MLSYNFIKMSPFSINRTPNVKKNQIKTFSISHPLLHCQTSQCAFVKITESRKRDLQQRLVCMQTMEQLTSEL